MACDCAASGSGPEPAEEDVPPQQPRRLRGHLRGRFQHPRSEYRNTRQNTQNHPPPKKKIKNEGVFPPQDIHGPEDREMLARLAASTEDDQSADSEAAIEKYLRSVLAVENILTMDRLRQVGPAPAFLRPRPS